MRRQLTRGSRRLAALHAELEIADEQLRHLGDDADDEATRALVADSTAATRDARHAAAHAESMRRHRDATAEEIARLEARRDELLDRLGPG